MAVHPTQSPKRSWEPIGLHVNTKMNGGEAGTKKYVTNTWVRLSEKLGMRSIILSRLELEFEERIQQHNEQNMMQTVVQWSVSL